MIGRSSRIKVVGFGALGVCMLLSTQASVAQQARTRTLTYDPERKSWAELPAPQPGTPEGDVHAIRVRISHEDFKPALSAVKDFSKRHGQPTAVWPEVLIAKAEALIGQHEYGDAHEVLQEFLSKYGGTILTTEALRLEFIIAEAFLGGAKRKVWVFRLLSGEDLGLRILDEICTDYPESELAELATKTKADYLFRIGEHGLAQLEYATLQRDYPQSRYQPFALRRLAESALAGFAGVDYDAAALVEAGARYDEYRVRYPSRADREGVGLILDRIQETRAEKEYTIGAYYERTEHLGSAIFYYGWVCDNWPETIAATKAAERLELLGASGSIGVNEASDR